MFFLLVVTMKLVEIGLPIKYFHIKSLSSEEIEIPLFSRIKIWITDFKRGRKGAEDAPRYDQKTATQLSFVE